jgi:cation transport regulator ChaC
VLRSHGPSGVYVDYVLELDRALAAMGAADPEVSALARRLQAAHPRATTG